MGENKTAGKQIESGMRPVTKHLIVISVYAL